MKTYKISNFYEIVDFEGIQKTLIRLNILMVAAALAFIIVHLCFFTSPFIIACQTLEAICFMLSAVIIFRTKKILWPSHLSISAAYLNILAANAILGSSGNIYLLWLAPCILGAALFTDGLGFIFWILMALFHPTFVSLLQKYLPPEITINYSAKELDFLRGFSHSLLIIVFGIVLLAFTVLAHKRNKKVKESKALMAELIRILTYDIAAPTRVIKKTSEEILDHATKNQNFLKKIMHATNAIESIIGRIQELKDFSDLSRKTELSVVDLEEVIHKSVELYSLQLQQKEIEIVIKKTTVKCLALAEKEVLTFQVLPNLIGNSIKFSFPHSKIEVIIGNCQLTIKDNGVGIPEKLIPHLFSYDKSTNRLGTSGEKGTGFGMPLVKTLLTKMHAQLEIQSQDIKISPEDHGTSITITFQSP